MDTCTHKHTDTKNTPTQTCIDTHMNNTHNPDLTLDVTSEVNIVKRLLKKINVLIKRELLHNMNNTYDTT